MEIIRKCQGCGATTNRDNLIKITKSSKNGEIRINPGSKFIGRSLYLCKNLECLKQLLKKKKIQKEFKIKTQEDARVAINSMLASLDDSYSKFMSEDEFAEFEEIDE